MNKERNLIEKIAERTGATYDESEKAYREAQGDLLNAMILLEEKNKRRGLYDEDIMDILKRFVVEVNGTKLIVKRKEEEILSVPISAGAVSLVLAPLLSIGGLTLAMFSRYNFIIISEDGMSYNLNRKVEKYFKKHFDKTDN